MSSVLYNLPRLSFKITHSAKSCHSCDESIFMAEGTTELTIKYCKNCFACFPLFMTVCWYDEDGHHGEATVNSDKTYTVSYRTIFSVMTGYSMSNNTCMIIISCTLSG